MPESVYTGICWYARFPDHYSGVGAAATKELGEFDQKTWSSQIAEAIKAVKADTEALKLQNEFFEKDDPPAGHETIAVFRHNLNVRLRRLC